MSAPVAESGILGCGLPYAKIGEGGLPLIVLDSFRVEHRAAEGLVLQGMMGAFERYTEAGRTVYLIERPVEMPFDYSFDDLRDDYIAALEEIAEETRAERPAGAGLDLLGIGAGGMFALAVAAEVGRRRGDDGASAAEGDALGDAQPRIDRLAVVASGARMGNAAREAAQRWKTAAEGLNWRAVHREMVAMSYAGGSALFFGGLAWLFPELIGTTDYPWDFYITLREVAAADITDRLPAIEAETIFIAGAEDRLFPATVVAESARRVGSREPVFLPGAGHAISTARRKTVAKIILAFLAERATPS
jgi:pimeloyl-ACP methyl ester carboxylesterase